MEIKGYEIPESEQDKKGLADYCIFVAISANDELHQYLSDIEEWLQKNNRFKFDDKKHINKIKQQIKKYRAFINTRMEERVRFVVADYNENIYNEMENDRNMLELWFDNNFKNNGIQDSVYLSKISTLGVISAAAAIIARKSAMTFRAIYNNQRQIDFLEDVPTYNYVWHYEKWRLKNKKASIMDDEYITSWIEHYANMVTNSKMLN